MLKLVFGRAGSGKTHMVRGALKKLAQSGAEKLMLLVPEQASFENERAMLRLLGERDARRVSVMSFTRLVDAVQRRCGGFAGRRLDDGGRSIFMSLAVEQVQDSLEVFRKNAESTELVGLMLRISTELKMCEIPPEELKNASAKVPQGTLRKKMNEISLILSAYNALVSQSFIDPLDDLTRLRGILLEHGFFKGYTVMADSFQSFTAQEYDILEVILRQADQVCVTVCADSLAGSETDLFAVGRKTAQKLIHLAGENSIPVAAPVILTGGVRFRNPSLAALEAGIYRPARMPVSEPPQGVMIYEAKNRYDEASFVSAQIRNLVMSGQYRYRDFAVIARSTQPYDGILDAALERWEIPYFMDRPEPVDAEPLMRLILSAFRVVQFGFRSDDMFLYIKTGLAGLSTRQISELENYTFIWNISGKKWLEEWTDNPEGFSPKFSEQDTAMLHHINESREAVAAPLKRFADVTSDTDGEGMAAACYRLLCDVKAAENLRSYAGRLEEEGNPALAERELRVWDLLMKILDQTALVLERTKITRNRYAELLHLVIRTGNIASIPQGLDEVTVGDASRIRAAGPKVVFLIGAVQGEFPLAPGGDSLFSDSERRKLIRLGLPLTDTMENAALRERFLAYSALSIASERLFITWPAADEGGKALAPSSIPDEARAVLPKIPVRDEMSFNPLWFACADEPAFELAARKWSSNDVLSATLKDFFRKRGAQDRFAGVERAAKKKPVQFEDRQVSYALFGNTVALSATQIEKFALCRFSYFCRYGLNVRERKAAEMNVLEYGSLMHFLLERLFRNLGSRKILSLPPEELHRTILGFLKEYVEQMYGGLGTKTPRFAYLVARIADSAQTVALHIAEELAQSCFHPADFELVVGDSVGPLAIPLPDGGEVHVDGKIDRVDLMDRDGIRYLRIVDYKTGEKKFRLSDVVYGLDMQMLIYLAALCENGEKRYGKFVPAGVLYMPADRPSVQARRDAGEQKLKATAESKLRMDGLVLDDPEVIRAMDRNGGGEYLPVRLKNGLPDKKDHIVSQQELKSVLSYLKTLIVNMAEELRSGDVTALPLTGKNWDVCKWCPYSSICGHEKDDPVRKMAERDRDAAMKEFERNGGEQK